MPIIKFKQVGKHYGDNVIVKNLSFHILRGDFLTIIGSSGSGKTTILKMINGLIKPDEGTITINDEDIKTKDIIELRRGIGYCIQGNVLFPHMTIEENISYVPNLINPKDKEKNRKIAEKWIEVVELPKEMLNRYPDELSGGQQQRVGIARALAAEPQIILMDEPFGALDEITRKQLQMAVKEIHKKTNVTIVFVTHDINEALYLGTKVMVMDKGKIQQYDTPERIVYNSNNNFVEQLVEGKELK